MYGKYDHGDAYCHEKDGPEELQDYNWACAFEYSPLPRTQVERVIAKEDGENDDEKDWIGLFHMKDGRYMFLKAGCDYTGWGCQASGEAVFFDSELLAIQGMGDQDRNRLNLKMQY